MGHARTYTYISIVKKYYEMSGIDTYAPFGLDACGLPAENYAKENNISPVDVVKRFSERMMKVFNRFNFGFDLNTKFNTSTKEYQKIQQEYINKFIETGYATKEKSIVNWDPVERCCLANEQVINGRGWRSGAIIEYKIQEAWYINIRQLSKDLILGLDELNWPEDIKLLQKGWIGQTVMKYRVINGHKVYHSKTIKAISDSNFLSIDFRNPKLFDYYSESELELIIQDINANKYALDYRLLGIKAHITKNINYSIYEIEEFNSDAEYLEEEEVHCLRNWCIERNRNWGCPFIGEWNEKSNSTMDTFVDSSHYHKTFLELMGKEDQQVDFYAGGIEHACMHLIYSRAFFHILYKIGLSKYKEPYLKFLGLGMVLHEAYVDENNNPVLPSEITSSCKSIGVFKMSKSKRNITMPEELLNEYSPAAIKMGLIADSPIFRSCKFNKNTIKHYEKLIELSKKDIPSTSTEGDIKVDEFFNSVEDKLISGKTNWITSQISTLLHYYKKGQLSKNKFNELKNFINIFK